MGYKLGRESLSPISFLCRFIGLGRKVGITGWHSVDWWVALELNAFIHIRLSDPELRRSRREKVWEEKEPKSTRMVWSDEWESKSNHAKLAKVKSSSHWEVSVSLYGSSAVLSSSDTNQLSSKFGSMGWGRRGKVAFPIFTRNTYTPRANLSLSLCTYMHCLLFVIMYATSWVFVCRERKRGSFSTFPAEG